MLYKDKLVIFRKAPYNVIWMIGRSKELISMGEVARVSNLNYVYTTQLLNKLHKIGIVDITDLCDKCRFIGLTEKGRKIYNLMECM